MRDFLIAVPAWGERHVWTLKRFFVPAIVRCATLVSGKVRFVIGTDRPYEVAQAFWGLPFDAELRDVTAVMQRYSTMSMCHEEALNIDARPGEIVILATADQVPSITALAAIEGQINSGKKVVAVGCPRALDHDDPPIGVEGETLNRWAWLHRHNWTKECTFGIGRTVVPAHVYFDNPFGVFMHGFHLHPFAVLKEERQIEFKGTIDDDLMAAYHVTDIHVVSGPAEFSVIELSPRCHDFPIRGEPNTVDDIAYWAAMNAKPLHRLMFCNRIQIVGTPAKTQYDYVPGEILFKVKQSALLNEARAEGRVA